MMITRKRLFTTVFVLLVVLGLAAAWGAWKSVGAKKHLDTARGELATARQALLDRDLPAARTSIAAAGVETAAARDQVGGPLLAVLAHVPILGRSFAVVRGVSLGADEIAHRVLPQALQVAEQLDPATLRRPGGAIDLAKLAAAAPELSSTAGRMRAVDARATRLPDGLLPGAVLRARDSYVAQVRLLTTAVVDAADAVTSAPTFLGADRPRRYFVMVQQTSESRGTGGLPGSYVVLEARAGKLAVTQSGSDADLVQGEVPATGLPADFVERYSPFGSLADWRNVNLSPDLPVVADLVEKRWTAQGGQPLDGVIALDAVALKDLLTGNGSITVEGGRQIPPEQFESYLGVDQYAGYTDAEQGVRKDQLVTALRGVTDKLTGGAGDSTALLRGVVAALRSGHLHLTHDDPKVASVLARHDLDGALPSGKAPLVYPVIFNATGGKLDYFLDRSLAWKANSCSGDYRRSDVTLTFVNRAPAVSALPSYVTISQLGGPLVHSNVNQVGVQVYLTKGASVISATMNGKALQVGPGDGHASLQPGSEGGLPVYLTYADLPPNVPAILHLVVREPTAKGAPRVPEQPLARPLATTVSVPTC